jgi:hypothetical protein
MKRASAYSALLFVVIFLLGAVTGGAVVLRPAARRLQEQLLDRTVDPNASGAMLLLNRKLHLDSAQKEQIGRIIASHQSEFAAIRRSVEPQLSALRQRQVNEIRAILKPEQRDSFEQFLSEMEARRRTSLARP